MCLDGRSVNWITVFIRHLHSASFTLHLAIVLSNNNMIFLKRYILMKTKCQELLTWFTIICSLIIDLKKCFSGSRISVSFLGWTKLNPALLHQQSIQTRRATTLHKSARLSLPNLNLSLALKICFIFVGIYGSCSGYICMIWWFYSLN